MTTLNTTHQEVSRDPSTDVFGQLDSFQHTVGGSLEDGIAQIECIDSIELLCGLEDDINRIANSVFSRTEWMVAWLQANRDWYEQINILVCRIDGQIVASLPLVKRSSLTRGRHFAFVGNGLACADFMTISGPRADNPAVIESITQWFWDRRREWDLMNLDGVEANDVPMQMLASALNEKGLKVKELSSLSTWRLALPSTWKEVESGFSKNARKKIRKLEKALVAANVKTHIATDDESLHRGLEILEDLHTQRWNSLGEPGCFASPCFGEFLRRTSKAHLKSGTLRLMWLECEGEAFSADIGFVAERGFFAYQGGISPNHLQLEPGRAILRRQIEWAIEDGLEFVDFLRGDESYKARWNATESSAVRMEGRSTGPRARSISGFLNAGRKVKKMVKRIAGRQNQELGCQA